MIYEIEIIKVQSKKIINAYKKDQLGIEYACADDLPTMESAIHLIRTKWKHSGTIFLLENGNRKIIDLGE